MGSLIDGAFIRGWHLMKSHYLLKISNFTYNGVQTFTIINIHATFMALNYPDDVINNASKK